MTKMREVTVVLLPEHDEHLKRLRMYRPSLYGRVDDAGVLAMALDALACLIHVATVNKSPHARHVMEHEIGLPPEGGTWPAADHDSTPN